MRRPLIAVLSVLVAATFASGHSAAQGSNSREEPARFAGRASSREGSGILSGFPRLKSAKAPARKLESVNACMKYRQQKLVEDGGLRMELRNCCHGPVKCAISWEVRCGGDGKADARSADLEISAGSTESAYGYGTECGNESWRITSVKWNCETAATGDASPGEL